MIHLYKKLQCPCCGNYTIDSDDEIVVEICEVCLWQYDEVAHKYPNRVIGANKISLCEAKDNYKLFKVAKKEYIGKNINREPNEDEFYETKN
ncbi:CPCC family cysteine-rich protein [Clostridium sp.]|uniref:CPCC family cysteine-rich protein n=1 Tax=Clostridium sp. TaxID=1506 RepID=UPI002FC79E7F